MDAMDAMDIEVRGTGSNVLMSLHFVQFTTAVNKLSVHKESRIWNEMFLHGPPQAGVHIV